MASEIVIGALIASLVSFVIFLFLVMLYKKYEKNILKLKVDGELKDEYPEEAQLLITGKQLKDFKARGV